LEKNGVKTTFQNVPLFIKKSSSEGKKSPKKNITKKEEQHEDKKSETKSTPFKLERKGIDGEIKPPPDWAV
jgi:hypothetical protein